MLSLIASIMLHILTQMTLSRQTHIGAHRLLRLLFYSLPASFHLFPSYFLYMLKFQGEKIIIKFQGSKLTIQMNSSQNSLPGIFYVQPFSQAHTYKKGKLTVKINNIRLLRTVCCLAFSISPTRMVRLQSSLITAPPSAPQLELFVQHVFQVWMERCSVLQDIDVLAHKCCTSPLKGKFIPARTFVSIKLCFDIHASEQSLHLVFLSFSISVFHSHKKFYT